MKSFLLFTKVSLLIILLSATTLLNSCGGHEEGNEETATADTNATAEVCTYSYDASSTELIWTSYKHTAKAPVKGVFDGVSVTVNDNGNDVAEAIANATFDINTSSINSNDSTRDYKIVEYFFKKMATGSTITGKITIAEGNNTSGSGTLMLTMNETEKEVPYTYEVEEDQVKLKAALNLEDFNGQDALASLNEVCSEKHTGADGVNKLWSDIDIIVRGKINKTCK